jgi:colicin import membrane protein
MNYALDQRESYRIPAGLLALGVHAAFFGVLVFSVHWQTNQPESFAVELWDSLPVVAALPVVELAPEPVVSVKEEPVAAVKADIEVRQKIISKTESPKPSVQELAKEKKAKQQEDERRQLEEYADKRRQTIQDSVRAEVNAATAAEVGRYQDMIRSKIRRNIVGVPPNLADNAKAEFKVTLLPGGMVLDAQLKKSSGNAAYDDAVERAIFKAQPFPLPKDEELQQMFRVLNLSIKPQE